MVFIGVEWDSKPVEWDFGDSTIIDRVF